jgi:signal transduction histidine kinase
MLAWLVSLRLWLLAAMLSSAAVGLAAAAVLDSNVEHSHNQVSDQVEARVEARAVARVVGAGADHPELAALQQILDDDQLTVRRGARVIYRGPAPPSNTRRFRAHAVFAGGEVTIVGLGPPAPPGATSDLILINAGVLGFVMLAALVTTSLVIRSVRAPVNRAISAADRVAGGDFSARMGTSGPQELSHLGAAFDDMAARLERTDADQRQFLADVAHEIATPVNSVSGFALALADGAADTEEQRAEASAVISTETRRLGELLGDLRELSRLDLTDKVRATPVGLEPFTRELVRRFAPAAHEAGLTIDTEVRPQGASITTDVRLLEMIASNLLSNAIRYTPAGGQIKVSVNSYRSKFQLTVRDSGVGIAPEHQRRIFERLYRVDHARDRDSGGLGLGLALAARAAHNLGGHIDVHSAPGRGSEFRLSIPLDDKR